LPASQFFKKFNGRHFTLAGQFNVLLRTRVASHKSSNGLHEGTSISSTSPPSVILILILMSSPVKQESARKLSLRGPQGGIKPRLWRGKNPSKSPFIEGRLSIFPFPNPVLLSSGDQGGQILLKFLSLVFPFRSRLSTPVSSIPSL
jgi:hypothetical protein